ncbi:MAG: hypothetical protein EPN61_00255 [Burkholderiaceae bacterium]|nr:MAG: hypothetical protein EPN61_00255 [Burkholderiaceae bacterium]
MGKLFAPEGSRKGLALYQPRVGIAHRLLHAGVELVGLKLPLGKNPIEIRPGLFRRWRACLGKPQADGG